MTASRCNLISRFGFGAVAFVASLVFGLSFAVLLHSLAPETFPVTPSEVVFADGLKYVELVEGTGPTVSEGQEIIVRYTGTLSDGRRFDNALSMPVAFRFERNALIWGWIEGLKGMRVGGTRRLIIPPHLAYGADGRPPSIPPDSTLIFDVELVGVRDTRLDTNYYQR